MNKNNQEFKPTNSHFLKKKAVLKTALFTLLIFTFFTTLRANTAKTGMRNISSMELIDDMGVGWNLGNTLDALGNSGLATETAWGNPYTTKAMIDEVSRLGFKTIRIPITWFQHQGSAPDYTIDTEWMDRVEEIANYCFANDMYVIINTHHEEGDWLVPTYANQAVVTAQLKAIWTQVSERFKDYGDYLIFETLNEPRVHGGQDEWNGGTEEVREVVNALNKSAVDIIRASGGNNASRFIMCTTVGASTSYNAINSFVIPNNDDRVIVSLHSYFPYNFALNKEAGSVTTWGSSSEKSELDDELQKIYDKFIANGHAVIMGEWGSINKNNTADREVHADYYAKAALARGIMPIVWDDGGNFKQLNRQALTWDYPNIVSNIVAADNLNGASYKLTVNGGTPSGTYQEGRLIGINASSPDDGYIFNSWTGDTAFITDKYSRNTSILMPNQDVEVTANYEQLSCNISGKIEAEDYIAMFGIQTGPTSEGGLTVGWIDPGDWMEYCINPPTAGYYTLDLRVASTNNTGKLNVLINGETITSENIPNTEDWDIFTTITTQEFLLEAGPQLLKFDIEVGLFNINWFEFVSSGNTNIPVSGIKLIPDSLTLESVGATQTLSATIAPDNASNKNINWVSSNNSVATVNSTGVVTAISNGSAIVTATTADGNFSATCVITVEIPQVNVPVTGISLNLNLLNLNVGENATLIETISPSNANNKSVSWTSNDSAIATINNGTVSAIGVGTTTIMVKTIDGAYTAECTVTVKEENTADCTNPEVKTVPFTQNGKGEFCWEISELPSFINSWNLEGLSINGQDYTNNWSNSFPTPKEGKWLIHYKSNVDWGHFEAQSLKSAQGKSIEEKINISVFPMPFDENFTLELSNPKQILKVQIFDVRGSLIQSIEGQDLSKQNSIHLNEYGSIFLMKIQTENSVETKTLIRK